MSVCKKKLPLKSVLLASAGILLSPAQAIAQDGPTSGDTQQADEGGFGVIIVTAQRREQEIQDVPVAITALNEDAIENLNSRDIRDLTGSVPNVVISEIGLGPGLAQIAIRGVNTQDPEKSFDPAVGVFVDNIYLGSSAFNLLDPFSLERIEVLRGPQGTLFGRNTTGGAINAQRRRPKGEFGARGQVIVGNFGQRDFQGELNLPEVGGILSGLIRGQRIKDDGVFENSAGGATGARDSWSIGGALRFNQPGVADITITYDHVEDNSELQPYFAFGLRERTPIPIRITQTDLPVPATITPALSLDPLCTILNRCFDTENRVSSVTAPNRINAKLDAISFNGDFPISDNLDLTTVLGWRSSTEEVFIDFDGTDEPVLSVVRDQDYEQYSAEVRLASNFDGPINFVAGAFYFNSEYRLDQAVKLDLGILGIPGIPPGVLFANGPGDNDDFTSETFAIFSQVDWEFAQDLTLTLGGRATWDKKTIFTQFRDANIGLTDPYEVDEGVPANRPLDADKPFGAEGGAEESWFQFTPKVMLTYKPNDDALLYASFTRGYNAGGFSARAGNVPDATRAFDPEFINSYEVGGKFDLLDRRLRVNFAAFWNDYSDKQEETTQPTNEAPFTSSTVQNVASARFRGFEIEVSALPVDDLRIDLSLGYLDAKYTDFTALLSPARYISTPAQPAGTLLEADFSDLTPRRAPEFTGSLSLNYSVDVGFGELVLNGQGRYVSEQQMDFFNDERGLLPESFLFDAAATLQFGGPNQDNFSVTLFGKNLTNNVDVNSFTQAGILTTFGTETLPRRYGIELGFDF
ncbi:TonB-dependent receptor [Parasphingorhabdus cellanae]|uniref:TonB-dependent receptor n=1 Tax=Parasphingorhabdus cellanae TaxID=2806553 RepID=A0ABX7TA79_9SPHN|nr:TonB-dependent receptor [Parasphingorhabdus cellanae]QTD57267.1 TonB-dependent receptor [Parasphingorhabdus cellanae]